MYVSVIHTISNPDRFWSAAESSEPPEGVRLHSALPNEDGSKAVCLWEADSVDSVKEVIESTVGEVSSNEYFAVHAEKAQGLPA
jgi:hypothetical protein